MSGASRFFRVLGPIGLAVAAAEFGVRALRPREEAIPSADVDLKSYFTSEEIERGRRFARPQLALGLARAAVDLGALVLLVRRPPRALEREVAGPLVGGAIAGGALAVALTVPPLPLVAIARRRSVAVGLSTQTWRGWVVDLLKATGIEAVMAAGAGGAVLTAIRRYPRRWWLVAAGGSVAVGGLLSTLAPVLLDPVFNDFTPLPEGETRSDVLELARAAGVEVGEIYSVDASRRTTAANAYVTGLGPTKRVVLFDTLLDRYGRDEVRVVVAHELAHIRGRDMWRGVAYAALTAPAGALAVQRLSWTLSLRRATPAVLPGLALSAAIVAAPIGLVSSRLSRALERRADAYSLRLSRSPDAFISFERAIALQNVADLDPPRWVTSLLASHPPTIERIGFAVAYGRGAAGDRAQAPNAEPRAAG